MDSSTHWQNTCKTNDMRMEHLLKKKKYVDCKFLVGVDESEQVEFSGHKAILSMVSPVFETMFYGSLAEKSELIKIPDITPKNFQFMMEYIYAQKCNLISIEDAFELRYAAKKYLLEDLDKKCINYLEKTMTSRNVCQIYELAEFYNENALMDKCKEYISEYCEDVLFNENFLSVKLTPVLMIFDQQKLHIQSELILFSALQKYALMNGFISKTSNKHQLETVSNETSSDQDKALIKEAVKKIRFLSMSAIEFSEGPARSQLLTVYEGYSIILKISNPAKNIHAQPEGFSLVSQNRAGMDSSTDWQYICTTNVMRLQFLLKEKKNVDCKFLVGAESEQEELSGHKVILSMFSPVFETMFYGSLPEKSDLIKIPDIKPKIFQSLLEYIYIQNCNLTSIEDAFQLNYAAKKYLLKNLNEHCIKYLEKNITSANVWQFYEIAEEHNENTLMDICKEHIATCTQDVLLDEHFLSLKLTTVLAILDINILQIQSEVFLFNALHKYALTNGYISNASNKEQLQTTKDSIKEEVNVHFGKDNKDKALIKDAVKKIRFLTMTPKEFSESPARSQLLTDYEGYSILLDIISPKQGIRTMPEGFCLIRERRFSSD